MREIEQKVKVEKHQEANQQKEFRMLGQIRVEAGHKLFSYNTKTFEIREVKPEKKVAVDMTGAEQKIMEAFYQPGCFYVSALNIKNAHRKIVKLLNEVIDGKTDSIGIAQLPS